MTGDRGGGRRRPDRRTARDPFRALGLPADPGLTDDDVRAAWRRVAAATHPDRADGGDPERFAVAAAAYTALRTRSGRGEALADLAAGPAGNRTGPRLPVWARGLRGRQAAASRLCGRLRAGRPGRLALRVIAAAAVSAAAMAIIGFRPAPLALMTGALTWLVRTGRRDLAPPSQRGAETRADVSVHG